MSRFVSVAHLTALETPPPDLIRMAADAGFHGAGLRLIGISPEATAWPLMTNRAMLRDTIAACRETGMRVPDIEFIRLTPELEVATLEHFLAAGAELGARHVISAPYDNDLSRLSDKLAQLNALALRYGLSAVLEFFPWTTVPDLSTALNVIDETGDPDIGVLVDSLHFDRAGRPWPALAQVDPKRMPFCHLADADACESRATDDLIFVARENRLPPGDGAIDLKSFLSSLPDACAIAVEVPNAAALKDHGAAAWIKRLGEATQHLLSTLPSLTEARA